LATTDEAAVVADEGVDTILFLTRHDRHGEEDSRALEAGKNVFVEKPLALTTQEIAQIDGLMRDGEGGVAPPILMVGFNRRFAPASRRVREFFADIDSPLTVSIRFNAGTLPDEHWAQDDEIGGGRIVGEACHGIDLAAYLAGAPPIRVYCDGVGGTAAPTVTQDRCFLTLRHANGAVSSIAYLAGGDGSVPKERVEVVGGGRMAIIDDFRGVALARDGRTKSTRARARDKGHRAGVQAFVEAAGGRAPAPVPWPELRAVSLAAIYALQSLREGMPLDVTGS